MIRHKRRPTLDELKEMPLGLLRMEIAQLCVDAALADNGEVLAEVELLAMEPEPQPERIVELWNQLRGESGSTELADSDSRNMSDLVFDKGEPNYGERTFTKKGNKRFKREDKQ